MKIIDAKGRLGGKINVIDFLVLVFLSCILLTGASFVYKSLTKPPEVIEVPKIEPVQEKVLEENVRIQVKFSGLMPELIAAISPGDVQKETIEGEEKVLVKVGKLISNEPKKIYSIMPDGENWKITKHPESREVVVELDILCQKRSGDLFFKNTPVKIGMPFGFSTSTYSTESENRGVIIKIERGK